MRNGMCFGHDPRVGAHDTIDVGPDPHLIHFQRPAQNRRRVIATTTPQGGLNTIFGGSDETGDHRNLSITQQGT